MNNEYCPQCPNHCHKSELRCGRGKAYFGVETKEKSNEHHHEKRQLEGVAGLIQKCGHALHHGLVDGNKLCQNLTDEEKKTLENLLNKILSNIG